MENENNSLTTSAKKKISAYLIEFVLLFLAVFLGFVAENIREDISDKKVVEEQMKALVKDLKFDTTRLGRSLRINTSFSEGLDSLRLYIRKALNGDIETNNLYYYYLKYGGAHSTPYLNGTTHTQLKESGLIRLLKSEALKDGLADYYERRQNGLRDRVESLEITGDIVTSLATEILSYKNLGEGFFTNDSVYNPVDKPRANYLQTLRQNNLQLGLLDSSPIKLEKFYNYVSEFELEIKDENVYMKDMKGNAVSLINLINKEYHFQ